MVVERLARRCGFDAVSKLIPEQHRRLVTHIRKERVRKDRIRAGNAEQVRPLCNWLKLGCTASQHAPCLAQATDSREFCAAPWQQHQSMLCSNLVWGAGRLLTAYTIAAPTFCHHICDLQQLPALLQGGDVRSMRTGVTGRARTAAKSAWAHSEVFSDEEGAGEGAPTMSGVTAAQKSARGAKGAKSAGEWNAQATSAQGCTNRWKVVEQSMVPYAVVHVDCPGCSWLGRPSHDVLMARQQSFVTRPTMCLVPSGSNCSSGLPSSHPARAPGSLASWLELCD